MPIIAEIAKSAGAIVISVVTIPFTNEGSRKETAYQGLDRLREHSDTVVIIENDKLLDIAPDLPIQEAFSVADEILANYIHSIITTVSQAGLINVDFADLKTVISSGGVTTCGVGEARGKERAIKAVQNALNNPLVDINYDRGTAALIHVTGGPTMTLKEASSVVEIIREKLEPEAEVIWGTKVDPDLGDILRITVVISGVESESIVGKDSERRQPIGLGNRTPVAGQSVVHEPIKPIREKENWLRKETTPTIRDLRKLAKERADKKDEERKPTRDKKEESNDEFWEELGLSKGLN